MALEAPHPDWEPSEPRHQVLSSYPIDDGKRMLLFDPLRPAARDREELRRPRAVGRQPGRARQDQIPLPVRIVHVARDAAFQRMLGGDEFAARVVRERAGHAFDPAIATLLVDEAAEILALEASASAWVETLAREPRPHLILEDAAIERALAAMGDFTDLVSPYLVRHSAGVAELVAAAAVCARSDPAGSSSFGGQGSCTT